MLTVKKLPWVSLVLLLVTYITLGWILFTYNAPLLAWVTVVIGILLLAGISFSPRFQLRDIFTFLFKTDTRAFLVAVVAAFLVVVFITWLHIFAQVLVITSATALFKLDTQAAGLSYKQIFFSIVILSLTGLSLGAVAQTVVERFLT